MLGKALFLASVAGAAAFAAFAVPSASAHPCFQQTAFPNCGACAPGLVPHYHALADDPANPYCVSADLPALGAVGPSPFTLAAWWAGSTGL